MAYEKDCNVVTTLSGTEYIRALAEDGSTVRIPVAELGKVMARVMPVATSERNGILQGGTSYSRSLLYRDALYDANIDKAVETGIYYKSSAPAAMPTGTMGYIIVIAADIYVKQIHENLKDGRSFTRISIDKGETWGSWNER